MRKSLFSICAILLLGITSCGGDIDVVKNTSMSCSTLGFDDGKSRTHSVWPHDAEFYLFRSEDWSAALMTLTSGDGSANATFSGNTAGTKSGYYAITPTSSAGAILTNGSLEIKVEPNNIFTSSENSAVVTPQIATGKGERLTFTNLFGAVKFNVGVDAVTFAEVSIPNKEHGLYGTYEYSLPRAAIKDVDVVYTVSRIEKESIDIASDRALYVALPVGEYQSVDLVIRDDATGSCKLFQVENVTVKRGRATTANGSVSELSQVVGSWHIKSFCGDEAEVDLYIKFDYAGNFVILQRSGNMSFVEYTGTYTIDKNSAIISGEYSDGEKWANSYKFSLNSNAELVLESVSDGGEISVYEMSEMPEVHISRVSAPTRVVKPL